MYPAPKYTIYPNQTLRETLREREKITLLCEMQGNPYI